MSAAKPTRKRRRDVAAAKSEKKARTSTVSLRQATNKTDRTSAKESNADVDLALSSVLSQLTGWIHGQKALDSLSEAARACCFVDSPDELGAGVSLASDGLILTAGHC